MSVEKEDKNNLGNRFGQLHADNKQYFNDDISRSYSSGINVPTVSTNLLRVYSRSNITSHGSLQVRSSPSSPNRLSRLHCMTQIHKKWPGLTKVNTSSCSESEFPGSPNSNKSGEFSYTDQCDLPNNTLLPTSVLSNATKEEIEKDSYPYNKIMDKKKSNVSVKQAPITTEDDNSQSVDISSFGQDEDNEGKSQKFSFSFNKLSSSPINFKKVLRDRYLNSQRGSATNLYTPSSPNLISNSDRSKSPIFTSVSLSSEPEDHNFKIIEDSDIKCRQEQTKTYQEKSSYDVYRTRNVLSLDLINLTMPKPYRLRSNNSTVSSASGVEPEGDPFSPASVEICSPLLKLNLPYSTCSHREVTSICQNLIPSSSMSALSSITEGEDFRTKSEEYVSAQRFFPHSMRISDFNLPQSSKSDSRFDYHLQNHLTLPRFNNYRQTSKSAPQSVQISPTSGNISHFLSSNNLNNAPNLLSESSLSLERSNFSLSPDRSSFKQISNCRSMSHISGNLTKKEVPISKSFDANICKISKTDKNLSNESCHTINTSRNLRQKTRTISNTAHSTKKMSAPPNVTQRQCDMCGRRFKRSDMLARHIRVHTGHKPFECSICGQSFSRSDHLNTHLRIHSGEKPYRCSICSYSACRRDMITRHLRVHKRKGDILSESSSSLVLNINKPKNLHQNRTVECKPSKKSHNRDRENYTNLRQSISSFYRSSRFSNVGDQCNKNYKEKNNSFSFQTSSSATADDGPARTCSTFANISISISQPTPRSSFSIPMETQNY